ncbi:phosphoribosyl-ATP diphosphatase [Minwuia sp.]|uniref:phosphoribosyl-ATP diphosphatase n=1 Tax=Minwuia sp. TaxID=2493630 RepID=UPI003A8CA098
MANDFDILQRLFDVAEQRKTSDPAESYVAKLHHKGVGKIAQKVGEEGLETALAAVSQGRADTILESADLLFHLTILWSHLGIQPDEVMEVLRAREGTSGLAEKASRQP